MKEKIYEIYENFINEEDQKRKKAVKENIIKIIQYNQKKEALNLYNHPNK